MIRPGPYHTRPFCKRLKIIIACISEHGRPDPGNTGLSISDKGPGHNPKSRYCRIIFPDPAFVPANRLEFAASFKYNNIKFEKIVAAFS